MRRGGFCSYGKTTENRRKTDADVLGLTLAGPSCDRPVSTGGGLRFAPASPIPVRPTRASRREEKADGRPEVRQAPAAEPPRHRGAGTGAAPQLLLRDGALRGRDPPAVRRGRHLLERGGALQHRAESPGAGGEARGQGG